ncbi:MAG: polysaccharide biosynthesis tyrosine autokinase [Campylobacterota bacterium]|nr:polysaccharide biosynthesis tyrosine autokinase [Campylobacterota bacterium]
MNGTKDNSSEMDFKEIISVLSKYKAMIISIAILFIILSAIFAYLRPSIYQSSTLLKIDPRGSNYQQYDLMSVSMGYGGNILDDEIVILQTKETANRALKYLDLGTRYFVNKNFKTYELYKDSPFVVTYERMDPMLEGRLFELSPLDDERFRLKIKLPNREYDQIHYYSKEIETPRFTLNIEKIYPLSDREYTFSIEPNETMGGMILSGLSASAYTKSGNIIQLNFRDQVPLRAKDILDAIAKAYVDSRLELKSEGAKRKLYFIDLQLKKINKTLQGSSDKLQDYKVTNTVVNLDNKVLLTSTKISALESRMYEIDMHGDLLNNILMHIKSNRDIKGINMGSMQNLSPVITGLVNQIQTATSQLDTLSVNYTKAHPDAIKIRKRLTSLKSSLEDAINNSIRILEKRKLLLGEVIAEQEERLKSLPEQEQELEKLTRNFIVNEKIYSMLLEERAETSIIESSAVSDTRVINSAYIPSIASTPKRKLIVAIGFVLGLILGIALAFLRYILDTTITTIEDIESLTTIPIYGAIPHINSKQSVANYKESMRAIWINLEFSNINKGSMLLTFTSSVAGEGKSMAISQLGKTISRSHKSAIIIDLDMRKATLHKVFGLSNDIGASTLLSGQDSLNDVVQDSLYDQLQVITSGPKPPNPTELIMAGKLDLIIKELKKEYDYILLDSPPVGLVADALKIMHMSDITIFMIKSNFSKKEFIKNINSFIEHEDINIGIIVNDLEENRYYGYGYGYGGYGDY